GPGRSRGASAYIRKYQMLADETVIVLRSDRRRHLPFGVEHGKPGTPSLNMVYGDEESRLVPVMPMEPVILKQGEIFCHIGAGGGGFGDPLERDPQKCFEDIWQECYSAQYAEEVYGVVLKPDGSEVDDKATKARRDGLRQERSQKKALQPSYLKHFLQPFGLTEFTLTNERLLTLKEGFAVQGEVMNVAP